jgi:hypothetical protein
MTALSRQEKLDGSLATIASLSVSAQGDDMMPFRHQDKLDGFALAKHLDGFVLTKHFCVSKTFWRYVTMHCHLG